MARNHNPFTERQLNLLKVLRDRLSEITDPEPQIITHEDFEWHRVSTKEFGRIPKIRFQPSSTRIKADLVQQAGLINKEREKEAGEIRMKYGIRETKNRHARLFESEWNNIMIKAKKSEFPEVEKQDALASAPQPPPGQGLAQPPGEKIHVVVGAEPLRREVEL